MARSDDISAVSANASMATSSILQAPSQAVSMWMSAVPAGISILRTSRWPRVVNCCGGSVSCTTTPARPWPQPASETVGVPAERASSNRSAAGEGYAETVPDRGSMNNQTARGLPNFDAWVLTPVLRGI
eukprot:CAMPEP_0117513082 /NCGR_PEP_ID=MMETSP0784-20121206/29365_1 /TAXON_ID=39447 /ORGANISM="" /LENGTH=128 /DNA_ID=CAMNT_0005308825 /DNA_START=734 /DNA_END=1120 /DNA_ORIENTATION=+